MTAKSREEYTGESREEYTGESREAHPEECSEKRTEKSGKEYTEDHREAHTEDYKAEQIEVNRDNQPCCCHSDKTKVRSDQEVKDLMNRLSRIEGQVRGLKGMVEKDAYCPDIMTQVSAVTAALNSFNRVLLSNHVRTCVAQDIRDGKDEVIDELLKTLQKMMR